jgi:hypothetical protein
VRSNWAVSNMPRAAVSLLSAPLPPEVGFATDSSLEETGFEPPVPQDGASAVSSVKRPSLARPGMGKMRRKRTC